MDRRKIIIIISILTLGTILGGAYWYFSKKVAQPTPGGLFPGESSTSTTPTGNTPAGEGTNIEPVVTPGAGTTPPRLYELHKTPVAGAGFIETKDKKGVVMSTTVRYLERGLGYIFETPLDTYTESRIVNETRQGIAEALWGDGGKSVVVRFVDDKVGGIIRTRVLNINAPGVSFARSTGAEATPTEFLKTEEVYLPDYIPFMATSEDGADKIFYLESGASASIGSTATFKDTSVSTIFSSSFTEWLPQFPNQNLVTLTTKPSATVLGYLYFLDPKTKAVTKILGNLNGLTTLTSRDGKLVLYAETKGGHPELSFYNVSKKETRPLNLQTLPEKCAWSAKQTTVVYCAVPQTLPAGTYPDQWYQGLVSFSDAVWKIDTTTLVSQKIISTKELGAPVLDIINPVLSSDDSYLLFMNKISGTPWIYSIIEPAPVKAAPPQPTVSTTATTSPVIEKTSVAPSVISPDMQKLK